MENLSTSGIAQDVQELINVVNKTGKPGTVAPSDAIINEDTPGFGELMKSALDSVNQQQKTAAGLMTDIETGKSKDLLGAMLASQKASLSFQALVQIRNKAVAAYEEIMRMQV
ncbi:MAG: flagellar hook-basal body complex protein FliE [Endozoicomonas sp.]|uniref:flagellar hook-basal body complex protein FliE n=1 Tax=Endozoicomonas sp. TaxID=1892382 RepID=UPI003D9BA4F8